MPADLKEVPLYEKLNAKTEIRGIRFKYQMSLLARQPSSSSQTERLMLDNLVPLRCANINYQSFVLDKPASAPIQRSWRKSAAITQGGKNFGGFLSGVLSSLSSTSPSRSWKET